jgi:hypothetical protein
VKVNIVPGEPDVIEFIPEDFWSLDHTLSKVILPALVKFREDLQGAPFVDQEDVPELMRIKYDAPQDNQWDIDDERHFARWAYIIDEMIYAFTSNVHMDDELENYGVERVQRGMILFGKYFRHLWI